MFLMSLYLSHIQLRMQFFNEFFVVRPKLLSNNWSGDNRPDVHDELCHALYGVTFRESSIENRSQSSVVFFDLLHHLFEVY